MLMRIWLFLMNSNFISDETDDGDIETDGESSAQNQTIENNLNGSRSESIDEATSAALNVINPNSCDLYRENTDMNTDNSSQMENTGRMEIVSIQNIADEMSEGKIDF